MAGITVTDFFLVFFLYAMVVYALGLFLEILMGQCDYFIVP
jgi:hypothetical protein